jgi:hypothetical protein
MDMDGTFSSAAGTPPNNAPMLTPTNVTKSLFAHSSRGMGFAKMKKHVCTGIQLLKTTEMLIIFKHLLAKICVRITNGVFAMWDLTIVDQL